MEQRLSLITLGVANLARARAFYEQGLGWRPSPAGNEEVAFYQLNGLALALYARTALAEDAHLSAEGEGFRGVALAYNARTREEADAVLKRAAEVDGTLVKAAQDTFWGGYAGYFADPDGHLWEVAWNPHFPLNERGELSLPQ